MADDRTLESGDTAPDFELTTLRGDETFRLSAQRGRYVLLFFIREFS
jgi:peroxiredoxin